MIMLYLLKILALPGAGGTSSNSPLVEVLGVTTIIIILYLAIRTYYNDKKVKASSS